MTKDEFAKALGFSKQLTYKFFVKAETVMPSIAEKRNFGHKYWADYTREEINAVLSVLNKGKGATLEQKEKVDNIFKERKEGKVHAFAKNGKVEYYKGDIVLKGTNKFLENPDRKCCSTCAFCKEVERVVKVNKIVSPFCSIYNRFCEYMGNVYEDYCAQWEQGKVRYWKKNNGSLTDLPWSHA